jgi:hypothetical protein
MHDGALRDAQRVEHALHALVVGGRGRGDCQRGGGELRRGERAAHPPGGRPPVARGDRDIALAEQCLAGDVALRGRHDPDGEVDVARLERRADGVHGDAGVVDLRERRFAA